MTIQLQAELVPAGGQTFSLLEDIYLKGGLQIRNDIADRDSIPFFNLKLGALVLTLADRTIWQVSAYSFPDEQNPDAEFRVEWEVFSLGGDGGGGTPIVDSPSIRSVVIRTLDTLPVSGSVEFDLRMAVSCISLKLTLSRPARVKVFGTPARDETNPYEFLATPDHLTDDGRQLLADGTIFRTRNYSIFANFEEPPTDRLYFTLESVDDDEGPIALTIVYLPLEILANTQP